MRELHSGSEAKEQPSPNEDTHNTNPVLDTAAENPAGEQAAAWQKFGLRTASGEEVFDLEETEEGGQSETPVAFHTADETREILGLNESTFSQAVASGLLLVRRTDVQNESDRESPATAFDSPESYVHALGTYLHSRNDIPPKQAMHEFACGSVAQVDELIRTSQTEAAQEDNANEAPGSAWDHLTLREVPLLTRKQVVLDYLDISATSFSNLANQGRVLAQRIHNEGYKRGGSDFRFPLPIVQTINRQAENRRSVFEAAVNLSQSEEGKRLGQEAIARLEGSARQLVVDGKLPVRQAERLLNVHNSTLYTGGYSRGIPLEDITNEQTIAWNMPELRPQRLPWRALPGSA